MTDVGDTYSVIGGFWTAAPCNCVGDLNFDDQRNGQDVQGLVDCMFGGGANCGCVDNNHDSLLDASDGNLLVTGLLATTSRP